MDRPRRSTRQSTSALQSPAPTPAPSTSAAAASSAIVPPVAMANGNATPSRFEAGYSSNTTFQQPMTPQPAPGFAHPSSQNFAHQRPHMAMDAPAPHPISQLSLQSLPNVHVVGRGAAPIAPGTSVAPPRPFGTAASAPTVPQAMYSTFPSRIKAGTTNLLQSMPQSEWYDPSGRPLDPLATPTHEYAGGSTPYRAARASGRRRAAAGYIRYAEAGSSDDDFEEDAAGTEDDAARSGSKRRLEDEDDESSRAYLGLPPPASRVVAKRMFHRTNHVYHNDDDLARQAGRNEILVPIKIDLEAEQYRIKDSFTWNMNERLISPHHFARLLLEDLDIPVEPYATQITNMINQQIDDATGVADIEMEPAAGGVWASARLHDQAGQIALPVAERAQYDAKEELVKEGRSWDWGLERRDEEQRAWRKRMAERLDAGQGLGDSEDDLRVIVDYEVQILRHMLRDRLEWDLCSPLTPESFARKLCDDLGLSGEAAALIANSVREQLIHHKRAALELGLVGSGRVLKEKEAEIEQAWAELHAEKVDKQRKRLERATSASEAQSQVASANATGGANTREPSVQPSADEQPKAGVEGQESIATARGSVDADAVTGEVEARTTPAPGADDDDDEDVETLHLTATATAAPTREGTSTPAIQPASTPAPATRSSARLSNMLDGVASGSGAATPSGPAVEPVVSASQRLHNASYTVREILSRGPRPLEGIWRDWHESREFGPLLERLNDDDLEKLEEANIRASRRNRREAARAFGGRRRR